MSTGTDDIRRAALVALASGAVWEIGISPVGRVYIETDGTKRLDMLRAGKRRWIAGQHAAAAGTAAVPAAFARIALALPGGATRRLTAAAASALALGAPFFVWELTIRASDLERFAMRRLPGWTFPVYAWLHVAALGCLSGALWNLPRHRGASVAVGAIGAGSAATLAATGDIVPFVFYLAEQLAAASLLRGEDAQPPHSAPVHRARILASATSVA